MSAREATKGPDGQGASGAGRSGPERHDRVRRISRTATARLGFSIGFLIFYWLLGQNILLGLQSLHLFSSIVFVSLAYGVIRPLRGPELVGARLSAYYRTLADVFQVALCVHVTGGLDSPVLIAFALPVGFSSIGSDSWRGRSAAIVATLLVIASETAVSLALLDEINLFGRGPTPNHAGQIVLSGFVLGAALGVLSEVVHKLSARAAAARESAEAARLDAELARDRAELSREETDRIADLAASANGARGVGEVFGVLARFAREDLRANRFFLLLVNTDQTALSAQNYVRDGMEQPADSIPKALLHVPLVPDSGTLFRTFRKKRLLYLRDLERYPVGPVDALLVQTFSPEWMVQLPLVLAGRVVAIVAMSGDSDRRIARYHLNLLERMGMQLAGAVDRERLLRAAEVERDRAETLRIEAENARLETAAFSAFARKINEQTDANLNDLLAQIFAFISETFGIKNGVLSLVDPAAQVLRYQLHWSTGDRLNAEQRAFCRNLVVPLNEAGGALARTCERKRPFYLPRINREQRMADLDREIVRVLNLDALLHIPLVVREQSIGVLWCDVPDSSRRLTRRDIERLEVFTAQIAGAVHNAQLLSETAAARDQESRARLETQKLAEYARRLNETTDVNVIFDEVFGHLETTFGAQDIVLQLVDERKQTLRTVRCTTDRSSYDVDFVNKLRIPLNEEGGTLFRTYRKQKPFYARSIIGFPSELDRLIVERLKLTSLAQFPLVIQQETIGVLWLSFGADRRSRADIESIARFCDQIAGAIRTADLLRRAEAARAEAEAAHRKSAQLAQISRQLNESTDLREVSRRVLDYLQEEYTLAIAVLFLVDREGGHFEIIAHTPLPPEATAWGRTFRPAIEPASGSLYRTFRSQKPLHLNRLPKVRTSPVDQAIVDNLQLESFVHLPLLVQGQTVGILAAQQPHSGARLTRRDISAMQAFADQVAGAVHTSQLLQQVEEARRSADTLLRDAEVARAESDRLLMSILPARVAAELKSSGHVEPLFYDAVTVLFTDFVGFTAASQRMMPDQLVEELDGCFSQFDEVVRRNSLEKLKTIGDSYMCAAGLPAMNQTHAVDACLTALEFRAFMAQMGEIKKALEIDYWQIRIGVHSGPVTAGVIGTTKFAYDIWGDTVNTASRMESSGEPGRINISAATYALVKDFFVCEHRGKVMAKGKGELDMYFLERIHPELASDQDGLTPNVDFRRQRDRLEFSVGSSFAPGADGYTL